MDHVALITGASRGIGRAIALALAEKGWHLVINYRSNLAAAEETLEQAQVAGGRALILRADIQHANEREQLVHETLHHFKRIDLLVNNAGIAPQQRLDMLEITEASYEEVMAVNLQAPFFLTQRVAKHMIESATQNIIRAPQIINIGSLSAYAGSTNRAEYCLAKAGVAMMTRLFAQRLAQHGINVYEVRPGIIATDMTSGVREKYDELIAHGLTPIARWGRPEDVAQAVVMLAEGALSFSTGEVINVDGGFHLRRL